MDNRYFSEDFNYLRILLFLPIAWLGYDISANLVADFLSKDFITTIGIKVWRYGFDILQFAVFTTIGVIVAPKIVRLHAGILTVLNYIIAYIWAVLIVPSMFDVLLNNKILHSFLTFCIILIPMGISVSIALLTYKRKLKTND